MTTFTGKPCRKCGATERYVSGNHNCVACSKKSSQRRNQNGKQKKYVQDNSEKINAYNLERYHSLTEEKKLRRNRAATIAIYGLTLEDYDAMIVEQNGVCAVCKMPEEDPRRKHLCVDHDHETGKVRALLCNRCNRGMGIWRDNIHLLEQAVLYLKRYQ